jgi:hypothetical protein
MPCLRNPRPHLAQGLGFVAHKFRWQGIRASLS